MKYLLICTVLYFLLFSCAKEQPQAAWLKIDQWNLVENPDAQFPQGELSHNITQVFVNMNGKSLGVYELPAKIPIIADGAQEFVLIPGIINNGISKTKKRFPFMEQYKGIITLKKNDTVSFTPTTRYYSSVKFLIEDFESPSMKLNVSSESTAKLGRNDDPNILKWGNKYGEILLNDEDSLISFTTNFETVLPKLGAEVYLEFDYMNTNSALTSTISFGNGNYYDDPYLQINPQKEGKAVWKHAYVDLKENISFRQAAPYNEVKFTMLLDQKGTAKYFYIDNIKLVYP